MLYIILIFTFACVEVKYCSGGHRYCTYVHIVTSMYSISYEKACAHLIANKRTDLHYTDKKEKKIILIYKEIQNGAVAKSYMRKGFLIYEMHKYLSIYEEAVSRI